MSSDNGYMIGKRGTKYFAKMFFMSDEQPFTRELTEEDCEFDSFEEAIRYASEQYSEYGVFIEDAPV